MHKVILFASGNGTNAQALMEYAAEDARIEIVGLVSNVETAPALERARQAGVAAFYIPHEAADERNALLQKLQPDWACLAGYMRIFSADFLRFFYDDSGFHRVLNIHPSLLPAFPGIRAAEQAFRAGVKISGVTVHLVQEEVDRGPIVVQDCFERHDGDTFEDFCHRGKLLEFDLYTRALSLVADNRLRVENNFVYTDRVGDL